MHLNLCQLFPDRHTSISICKLPLTGCMSSTLTKLKINVETFNDCFYLLLGNLESLSTLIIEVKLILLSLARINNTNKLPELKCFSLASIQFTSHYENQIISLLRRMINLEELTLCLLTMRTHSTYIDSIQLHDQMLIYISRLNKFTFSINTDVINENIKIDLPSSEDIQHSFIGKEYKQVGSWIHYRSKDNAGISHIYSIPYQFEYFTYLSSSFQGGMFDTVRNLAMSDMHPLEHDLFKLVSQSFLLLKALHINNYQPQRKISNIPR
ncbi:unnamed protein product [Rotaria magnacalcarata]|nr:unnamed protein product [Rotaria magnacalcarata]